MRRDHRGEPSALRVRQPHREPTVESGGAATRQAAAAGVRGGGVLGCELELVPEGRGDGAANELLEGLSVWHRDTAGVD